MKRLGLPLIAALSLGACGGGADQASEAEPQPQEAEAPPAPVFDMELPGPEQTEPGALLDYWKGAVEAGDTDAARRAWRAEVRTGGTAPRWANLSGIAVAYGEGQEEGAAGSLYFTLPVSLTGQTVAEDAMTLTGTMVLRRVNDVPGASADQLAWRIESIDWDG